MTARVIKISGEDPDLEKIRHAAGELREGKLVIFPTETVYGLGVNLLKTDAVARAYEVKRRAKSKPFTVLISDKQDIEKWAVDISKAARAMSDTFWPGPLTLILCSKEGDTVGLRMPDNKIALRLIAESGVPVGAPSANIAGQTPPVTASEALRALGKYVDLIIDGGRARLGVASTVVDASLKPFRVLREGAIESAALERFRQFEE